jgi:hypothetical protein
VTDDGLPRPALLDALIETGRWPATSDPAGGRGASPLVVTSGVADLAPGEEELHLYAAPFRSVATDVAVHEANGWSFWTEFGALDELDPERALVIGDFGIGSDSPLLLDYRTGDEPVVLRLRWSDGPASAPRPTWVIVADSFDDLATRIGLN